MNHFSLFILQGAMAVGLIIVTFFKLMLYLVLLTLALVLYFRYSGRKRNQDGELSKGNMASSAVKGTLFSIIITLSTFVVIIMVGLFFFLGCKGGGANQLYANSIGSHKMHAKSDFEKLLINHLGTTEVYLDLNEDGTYELRNNTVGCLNRYQGTWDTNNDFENAYFELTDDNGRSRKTTWLDLYIECDTLEGMISSERKVAE